MKVTQVYQEEGKRVLLIMFHRRFRHTTANNKYDIFYFRLQEIWLKSYRSTLAIGRLPKLAKVCQQTFSVYTTISVKTTIFCKEIHIFIYYFVEGVDIIANSSVEKVKYENGKVNVELSNGETVFISFRF